MTSVGVIPARGGSKGVVDKNIRDLCGRPLIAWMIDAAKASKLDRVIVSTDDPKIGKVAVECGAEVKIRPPEWSQDDSPSEYALLDVLGRMDVPDAVVMLQCTSPLTRPEDIDACIDELDTFDCCFTVHETSALIWDHTGGLNHNWRNRPMRQDRMQYEETGAVYAMRGRGFLQHKYRFFGQIGMHVTPKNVDINDHDDFIVAEALMRSKHEQ